MSNRLEVKIDGNATGFKHAMDTVRTQAKGATEEISHSWGKGIFGGILGAFSFEAVKGLVDSFISSANEIKDISEQLEMSTDATQKWAKAAEDVGQNLQGVYSVLSAIQSKRQEALRDPKAADLFSGLGIDRSDVLNEDASEFAKRVLTAGGASAENRKLLEQIVGRRGLKLIPAASRYDEAQPDFDPEAIKAADSAEKAKKRASSVIGRFFGDLFSSIFRAVDDSEMEARKDEAKVISGDEKGGLLWRLLHRNDASNVMENQTDETIRKRLNLTPADKRDDHKNTEVNPDEDPLVGIKMQQMQEYYLQNSEAERGMHEAERRNMTIAGRKASIKKDLNDLNSEIDARSKSADLRLIYGMNQKQQSGMLQTDIDAQLHKDYLALTGLQTRSAGLTSELRDSKGFSFDADNMARVGLYSSSALRINPALQLQEKQLNAIYAVERAVRESARKDPFRP